MNGRVLGAALLALVVGGAGGYAVAAQTAPEPEQRARFALPEPMPASDPSLPVELVEPDPDDPVLETGISLEQERLRVLDDKGKPTGLELSLPVPVGWKRTDIPPAQWKYTVPGNTANSYGLRIEIIADLGVTVDNATVRRQSELRSAQAQGFLDDLEFPEDDTDGFEATFVDRGYRRINLERFFSGPESGVAYATVAVYGRERDRAGLTDLLERISSEVRPGQIP